MSNEQEMREAFENTYRAGLILDRKESGEYVFTRAITAWDAWQAATLAAEARIRELEAAEKDALFVLTYPTQAIFGQRSGPDSFQLRECDIKTAKEMQQCGYMYIDDDGNGPYFTDSKNYADRYLHSWAVFKVAPPDGHVCDYELAYGKCRKCLAIERDLTEHKENQG